MSSRFRLFYFALPALLCFATFGCVDPKEQFGDFGDRVIDAAPAGDSAGGSGFVPVNGEFLLAIQTSLGGSPIRLVVTAATTEGTEGGGTVDLQFLPLIFDDCSPGMGGEPAGDALPPLDDVPVAADGTFTITQMDAATPGAANPLTCGNILADISIVGRTISSDLFCGDSAINLKAPPLGMITGTFGAIQIETGARGDANLPDVVTDCPASGEADAGAADAS